MRRFHKEQKTADQATFEVLLGSELPVRAAPILPAVFGFSFGDNGDRGDRHFNRGGDRGDRWDHKGH